MKTESQNTPATNLSFFCAEIGGFRIQPSLSGDHTKIWISRVGNGEGGEFEVDRFSAVIEKFFSENF